MSKLLERLVQTRLRPHLVSSPNFSQYQSAFRPGYSTETSMLKITNDLLSSTLSGSASLVVTLDLSSAFDCVMHSTLLSRLTDEYGVQGLASGWIKSYLNNRTQFVKVGNATSLASTVTVGVPQGSVLGPLLFTAYIAPVGRIVNEFGINYMSYADDLTLYMNLGPDPSATEQRMSDCTSAVSKWLMSNGLLLNPAKSEVIRTGTSAQLNKINNDPVTVAGIPVSPKTHIKMLGVTFDSRLNFEKHVTETCSTASYHLRGLRHIRKVLDKPRPNTIACSIVNSRIDYCNSVLAVI